MANKPLILTPEGLKIMTEELDYLKNALFSNSTV